LFARCIKTNEKCKDSRKQNPQNAAILTAHPSKIIARILRRWTKRKIEHGLGKDQFRFRRGKVTRDVTGIQRIISERSLDVD
jgi:hypothetical protein